MSDVVIQVENLSKMYRIGARQNHQDTLRDALVSSLKAPLHSLLRIGRRVPEEEILWALKDVSFEVKQGEVIGIIGRNGAGKSTLLKILSRITEPTEGHARIHGRVGSLLEVGTGFHPELTGRENIYLNGAILGMARAEIERKFDEIVEFAEIERFIDTPVKRYSSGMYVRLAFAVAAHMESEILLVDEVLAVGDAQFQLKCLGKMGEVAKEGRTILFISHNMAAVRRLCSRGIVLDDGQIRFSGEIGNSISLYIDTGGTRSGKIIDHMKARDLNMEVLEITVNGSDNDKLYLSDNKFAVTVAVRFVAHEPCRVSILCVLNDKNRQAIGMATPGQYNPQDSLFRVEPGLNEIVSTIQLPPLNRGKYYLYISVIDPGIEAYVEFFDAVELDVEGYTSSTGVVLNQDLHGYQYLSATAKQRRLNPESATQIRG